MENQPALYNLKCIKCDTRLDVPADKKFIHCLNCGTELEVCKDEKGEIGLCYIVSKELKWEEYKLHIELYKTYFDLGLRANLLFYFLTGGILAFYFSNCNNEYIKYSLLLPMVASWILGGIFIFGAKSWQKIRRESIDILRGDLGIKQPPDVRFLNGFYMISGIIFSLVGLCILALLLFGRTMVCK